MSGPCINCRFYKNDWGSSCNNPALLKHDPVTGPGAASPYFERSKAGRCGPEGKHFVQKGGGFFHRMKEAFTSDGF